MTPEEYVKNAIKTESPIIPGLDKTKARLLHASMGCATESIELLDALKKHLFYNKPLDITNIEEEIGDLFWYISIIAHVLGFNFDYIWDKNIAKLKARYPDSFTEENAIHRDLQAERKILEDEQGLIAKKILE